MKKYRKKSVVIEAIRVPGWEEDAPEELIDLVNENNWEPDGEYLLIPTLEGTMVADPGDWLIHGVKGEWYPCKPDVFEATYDEVEEEK